MKCLKNVRFIQKFIFCLILILAPSVFAASPFKIAVIHDCQSPSREKLLKDIKNEIFSLTKGEFDVLFPAEYDIELGCGLDNIRQTIHRLLENRDVDMVLSLDPVGSQVLGQYTSLNKPCIAGSIFIPEIQGVPIKEGKSGISNLAYVAMTQDINANIKLFKELIPFSKVALLLDASIMEGIGKSRSHLDKIGRQTGVKFVPFPVNREINQIKQKLDKSYDAVFINQLNQLADADHEELIHYINKLKIPSFSLHQRNLIEAGVLAGFDRTEEKHRFARRIAIWTQQILLKENPKDFRVNFPRQEKLVINMATARELDISPSFKLMAKAELINDESHIFSPLATQPSSKSKIPLSPLVTGGDKELSRKAFGLNETQTSLSLLDAVNLSLKTNLLLKSRAKKTEAGKMNIKEALARFYPQLGAGLNYTMIDDEHTSAIAGVAERSWEISAWVSQLLYSDTVYTGLKTSRRVQVIQELSEHQEKLDIILNTALAYLNMLKARANSIIQMDNLKLVRSNLVLANNRYKAGFSAPSDVYRLESESAIAFSNFLDSLAFLAKTRIRLNQILNFNLENNTTIKDIGLDYGGFILSDPQLRATLRINNPRDFRKLRDFVVQKGLEESPEIKAIDEQIGIQQDAYDLARRSYWSPNIALNGRIGNMFSKSGEGSEIETTVTGPLSDYFKEPDDTLWTLGVVIEVPFFEGGAKSAQKIQALETKSELRFLKFDTQNKIAENIRSALYDLSASLPAIELARLSASSAKKNLDFVQDAYSKGAVSIVNFLDAQNASLTANTRAENAVYDFLIDYFISERAAGNYTFLMSKDERTRWLQDFQK